VEHSREGFAVGGAPPRFVIGIDLGTTNSAVAFADLREVTSTGTPRVRIFDVPQIVAEGEVAGRDTLPSFLYLLPDGERRARRVELPWAPGAPGVVGVWARDQGGLAPARLVSSAKSWLCSDAVDRRARILPWGNADGETTCSPVEASAAYLAHVRDAWNHAMASGRAGDALRFERQAVVLTVPASFDEEARELTVEAAGLPGLSLIEEPTAALYAWLAAHRGRLAQSVRDGERILICDVGGGTTDFTLVSVGLGPDGEPAFERTAVGHHLLLGGDNLDLALVNLVEEKLGRPRLTLRQQQALRRQCAVAKERLLGPPPVERASIPVLGSGAALVGGALSADLTRDEVLALLLDGFLPGCALTDSPEQERRSGLRELGLPFAADPAITRHLAAFLREAGGAGEHARLDAVLFNGGFFTPEESRARVAAVLGQWFGRAPRVLANASPATAVAEGAAYFGLAARGLGPRVTGGSPRAFYVALGAAGAREAGDARGPGQEAGGAAEAGAPADADTPGGRRASIGVPGTRAICVLPRGTEEGTSWRVEREFTVATNRPLSFTLLSSLTRRDTTGEIVDLDEASVHRHAPLVTELRFGKRSRQPDVRVVIDVRFTELGTLELWLLAPDTGHRWRLQFQLRAAVRGDGGDTPSRPAMAIEGAALDEAESLVRRTFTSGPDEVLASPETLMARLEIVLGIGKQAWPVAAVRPLADVLLAAAEGRRMSARHEARWLNLLGYCLRPGFGATLDEHRMTQARRVYLAGLAFPNDVQCQAEWLVLWQRIAGGLTAGQQHELFGRLSAQLGIGGRKPKWQPPQIEREAVRLLASLEEVPAARRAQLGDDLVERLRRNRRDASLLWAIGRVGARVPVHGPLNTVVPPSRAAAWASALLELLPPSGELAAVLVQMAARTGDLARDLDEDVCRRLHGTLAEHGLPEEWLARLVEIHSPSEADTARAYGESLPEGLRLA
jgi:molecular chaperone DnaK (HSP70)